MSKNENVHSDNRNKKYHITKENILAHELIGLKCEVIGGTDKSRKGIKGRVIDETKNTLKVETKNGEKILPKKEVILVFKIGKEKVKICGEKLIGRPEWRLKNWRKKNE